jgi:hypothetical protein
MRNHTRTMACAVLAAALPALTSCGDDPPDGITGPAPQSTPLRVLSVSPASGNAGVSTAIAISGAGFNSGTTLTLGGGSLPVTFVNSSTIRATAPPHAVGAVDVIATNTNGERAELAGGFRYVDIAVQLELTGNTTLQAVGERSQLTATATFSNGTTADVTREAMWSVSPSSVVTIDTSGVMTATGMGVASVLARYPSTGAARFANTQVVVTPPGSFAASGRVRQPGAGGVSGARVVHVDTGQHVESDVSGNVAFGGLTGGLRLRVTKDGYEDAEVDAVRNAFFDVPVQRVVRIAAGAAAYSAQLAPNDMDLAVGGDTYCQPCRLIRITSTTPGRAQVTLTWTGPATLQIWSGGRAFEADGGTREVTADVDVGTGDTLVVIGRPRQPSVSDYIAFTVVVRQEGQ